MLLEGETGTGKELAAEAIHGASKRRGAPFIVVDCGAIPAELLESELFGHERGAFTGAHEAREGAFHAAHGGTIFLDEIGELPLALQPRLLRALERREVKPIGATIYQRIDVGIIAATNRSLTAEVNEGRFRSDLFYRLAVLRVQLPPLRERVEDLAVLVHKIIAQLGRDRDPYADTIRSDEFVAALSEHSWPGNVRELRNYLEQCCVLGARLPHNDPVARSDSSDTIIDVDLPYRLARARWNRRLEYRYLVHLLERTGNNASEAARFAGLGRTYFYQLLGRHGLR